MNMDKVVQEDRRKIRPVSIRVHGIRPSWMYPDTHERVGVVIASMLRNAYIGILLTVVYKVSLHGLDADNNPAEKSGL